MAIIRLRFFAAARAAAGVGEAVVEAGAGTALLEVLATFGADHAGFPEIVARCSFLVNGIAETNPARPLADGDLIDVMPPFAGG